MFFLENWDFLLQHSPNLQGWSLAIRWFNVSSRTLVGANNIKSHSFKTFNSEKKKKKKINKVVAFGNFVEFMCNVKSV